MYKFRLDRYGNVGKVGVKISQLPTPILPSPWTLASWGWSPRKHFAFVYTDGGGDATSHFPTPFCDSSHKGLYALWGPVITLADVS